jgi:hypothetical protein
VVVVQDYRVVVVEDYGVVVVEDSPPVDDGGGVGGT